MEQKLTKQAHQSTTKQQTKQKKLSPQARTNGGLIPWELRSLTPAQREAYYRQYEEELLQQHQGEVPWARQPDKKQREQDEGKVFVDLKTAREKKQLSFYKVVGGKKVPATGPTFSPAPPL